MLLARFTAADIFSTIACSRMTLMVCALPAGQPRQTTDIAVMTPRQITGFARGIQFNLGVNVRFDSDSHSSGQHKNGARFYLV